MFDLLFVFRVLVWLAVAGAALVGLIMLISRRRPRTAPPVIDGPINICGRCFCPIERRQASMLNPNIEQGGYVHVACDEEAGA